jgi:hypothetical protein
VKTGGGGFFVRFWYKGERVEKGILEMGFFDRKEYSRKWGGESGVTRNLLIASNNKSRNKG